MQKKSGTTRFFAALGWVLFFVFTYGLITDRSQSAASNTSSIDYLAYANAAEAMKAGKSPFPSIEKARATWTYVHQIEIDIWTARITGKWDSILNRLATEPPRPGSYIYPPTLAQILISTGLTERGFTLLLIAAIAGFAWLWLRESGAHPLSLLWLMTTFELHTALRSGNVELLLLFMALLSTVLLWYQKTLWVAPLLALMLLIKPFYAILFVAFVLIQGRWPQRWLATVALTLALVSFEVLRWDPALRSETFSYMSHLMDYLWMALPPEQQTPLSMWNRTPLQALISVGVPMRTAQAMALGLWAALLGLTLWLIKGKRPDFKHSFALALILLYWGRPVGWGLVYLELIVATTIWPNLRPWQRVILCLGLLALMASRWWALILTVQGYGMPLMTLQRPEFAWETWLLIPFCWLLVMVSAKRSEKMKRVI